MNNSEAHLVPYDIQSIIFGKTKYSQHLLLNKKEDEDTLIIQEVLGA